MRVGLCQLESKTGDFEANLGEVVQGLKRADVDRVEIVCFPERLLTGHDRGAFPGPLTHPGLPDTFTQIVGAAGA